MQISVREVQRESRIGENRTHGLVDEVKPPTRGRRVGGFSLIELLIVIAIIAILSALLFPALSKAKEKATSIQCLNQVKQVGVGILSYANDYEEYYPYVIVPSDLNNIYFYKLAAAPVGTNMLGYFPVSFLDCPGDRTRVPAVDAYDPNGDFYPYLGAKYNFSYKLNMFPCVVEPPGTSLRATGRKFNSFKQMSSNMMYYEVEKGNGVNARCSSHHYLRPRKEMDDLQHHGKTNNYLFMDGHAETATVLEYFNRIRIAGDKLNFQYSYGNVSVSYTEL